MWVPKFVASVAGKILAATRRDDFKVTNIEYRGQRGDAHEYLVTYTRKKKVVGKVFRLHHQHTTERLAEYFQNLANTVE